MSHLARHAITYDGPAVNFFQGGVLGNGGLGAIVCTRPDALLVHVGHNDVWDIRINEDHRETMGTFAEVWAKVQAIPATHRRMTDDPWYRDYLKSTQAGYGKPYPRPMPCGTAVLGWDRRLPVEVLGHSVDPSDGTCTVRLLVRGATLVVRLFCDMDRDALWISSHTEDGTPCPAPFNRVALLADYGTPAEFPRRTIHAAEDALALHQVLPAQEPHRQVPGAAHPEDRAFRLGIRLAGRLSTGTRITWHLEEEPLPEHERRLQGGEPFVACVQLDHGLASALPPILPAMPGPTRLDAVRQASQAVWQAFWSRSSVALEDQALERIWYRNLYFLRCALRRGVTCPGLFANWSRNEIGTAWHGDYHMNYNTQQPFWVCFSSNHVDLHEPYVRLVNDRLLPLSQAHARDYYQLPGAAFPHSAYPVPMTVMPYPTPVWGWEVCETPWTVQSLWWHYRYTGDGDFLRHEAWPALQAATAFMVAYLERPEATGDRWGDRYRHLFPTVSPEMYAGTKPGLAINHDGLVDLTLTRFLLRAFVEASRLLGGLDDGLARRAATCLDELPPYATAVHPDYGEVFLDVPGGHPDSVFNTPNTLMTVFPGEEHGLHSPPEIQAIAANTLASHRNEGGNHLVFLHLQAARLGRLDLERFKRDVAYNTLANGTATDKDLEAGGRYDDYTPHDFMAGMGIWFENFALPVVINECLLQSYQGELRLFPNWPASAGDAEFRTLRAVGAFLVSARREAGQVVWIEVLSERGGELCLHSPWPTTRVEREDGATVLGGGLLRLATRPGERLRLCP